MSLFPRFTQEFSPLFRLIDDYDRHARSTMHEGSSSTFKTFSPKFDVRELKEVYELHGELPGIEEKNVNIEWTDGNTLTISGHTEHRFERGNQSKENGHHRQATVEDVTSTEEQQGEKSTPTPPSTEVAKTNNNNTSTEVGKPTSAYKYWVTERSVGEFHRAFSFPSRVDHDHVKASLKNGILSIVVPKAKRAEPRKIQLSSE